MSDKEMKDIILDAVLTVREVKEYWRKDQKTVMMAIYQDRLAARQANPGATWLITRASVVRLWGQPINQEVN